jgi:hypothetical protein
MENFANDIAVKMGNILSSKEHQNLFKKASDQTCCNNDCKCSSESCPCKKDKKTCSKSCGSCSSKKEAMQNVLSRLLRLSEALDQQGFEKQASTVLKIFAKLHRFNSKEELKNTIEIILNKLALYATGSDKEKAFALMKKVEAGHLLPVVEILPSLARTYEIYIPAGFAAGARDFLEKDFLEGRGEGDELSADDSNDLKHEDLSTLRSRNEPFESLSDEIEELEADPDYQTWEDENLIQPHTPRSIFKDKPEIDRFLEGGGEDELSADDCGEIRLPKADKSPRVRDAEQNLLTFLGDESEDVSPESFDEDEFQSFLEGEEPITTRFYKETLPSLDRQGPNFIPDTEPARVHVGDYPEENNPYALVTKPHSLLEYTPRQTLRSSAFMKLDKYFKKDAKVQLPENVAKWLSTAAGVVLKNSGKRFSEKEQSLFEKLSEAAKSGNAKPKHLNKLIQFCEEHNLNVPKPVYELAKTAAYELDRDRGKDLEAEDFEDEMDDSPRAVVKISPKLEKIIVKTMLRLIYEDESLRNDLTGLVEQTAETLDHDDWLDKPDHPVWTIAARIDEYEAGEDEDDYDEDEEDLPEENPFDIDSF